MLATAEIPVTHAAVFSYRVLQDAIGYGLLAYERPDGGLIVEHTRDSAPAVYYRITSSGVVEPDRRLNPFAARVVAAA